MSRVIMIVDDNAKNIQVVANILKNSGYRLAFATNGKEALDRLKSVKIDLILLDVMMPEMDGFETCKALKSDSNLKDIPVIFLTAKTETEEIVEGFSIGAVDYVTKPFNSVELLARVKTHLELKDYRDRLEEKVQEETQKRIEHEKIAIQKAKMASMGEMLSAITHQWKQPISVIPIIADVIFMEYEEEMLSAERLQKHVESIKSKIYFLSDTVQDFSNFFKPDKEKKSFFIKEEIDKMVDMLEPKFRKHSIKVEVDVCETIAVNGFSNEFKQVILNILNNAKDALSTSENRPRVIDIRASQTNESVTIEIEDNAGGIAENMLEKLFEPYKSSKSKGTGIGLWLSKTIINQHHNGDLSVRNSSDGAVFSIKLPL